MKLYLSSQHMGSASHVLLEMIGDKKRVGVIANAIDISKPRGIIGHGFTEGTSGSVSDLIRHFGFDEEGITNVALEGLRRFNK